MSLPDKSVALDEDGYALSGEARVTNEDLGLELLTNLKIAENGAYVSTFGGTPVLVEAFDEPLIARHAEKFGTSWSLGFPYGHAEAFHPEKLRVDEWDRFHGVTARGIPFVFSRQGQADFFEQLEEFDDDSITLDGKRIEIPPLYNPPSIVTPTDWGGIYDSGAQPPWDLGGAAPALKDMLPRLKLTKSRILILGCGEGHDAAFFAESGHVVTAVDFSHEALARAKEKYPSAHIKWLQADVFSLDREFEKSFDIIFDHTLYCAVDPTKRAQLVKNYWRWLAPSGHLMGVFFVVSSANGPPFGGTEWELRERLRKNFRFIFWGRWKESEPKRRGKELFVYAQKLEGSR